jgi:acetyl-CoA carboxylase carboxyl transferase subunit alpha
MARETEAHLRGRLGRLKNLGLLRGASISGELSRLERQLEQTAEPTDEEIWQRVELARHADRPYTLDYVERVFDDFIELHGDRSRAEDPAMIAGLGRFNGRTVALLGQQKGRDTKERLRRNYGMTYPEGYRKAMRTMDLAERHRFPIARSWTPRGRSQALKSRQTIPIVACVIGEGGSGGAIAIALADRVLMQENAMYSVISPEGCAAILWRDGAEKVKAAAALKPDAVHTLELGVIDAIVPEPAGGAHTNWDEAAKLLGEALQSSLDDLSALTGEELRRRRRDRFRSLGVYSSSTASTDSTGLSTEPATTRK